MIKTFNHKFSAVWSYPSFHSCISVSPNPYRASLADPPLVLRNECIRLANEVIISDVCSTPPSFPRFCLRVNQKNNNGFQMTVDMAMAWATSGQKYGCWRMKAGSCLKSLARLTAVIGSQQPMNAST